MGDEKWWCQPIPSHKHLNLHILFQGADLSRLPATVSDVRQRIFIASILTPCFEAHFEPALTARVDEIFHRPCGPDGKRSGDLWTPWHPQPIVQLPLLPKSVQLISCSKKKDLCLLGGGTFGVRQNLIQRGTEHSSRDASPEVRRTEWEFNNGAERSSALRMRKTVLRTVYGYFTTRHFRLMRPGSLGCLNDETNTRSSGKASHRDAFDAGFTSHATLSTD